MDTLILKECRFDCAIGVTAEERAQKQPVIIDIELLADTARSAGSDLLADTIDYLQVHEAVKECVESKEYNLVEAMGESVAHMIFAKFPVNEVTLTLRKTKPMEKRNGAWAGIRMTRKRPGRAG